MKQPKLGAGTLALLDHHEYVAKLYQPVHLFKPGKRKLPNVAEPDDPWECFLRRPGEFGVVASGRGDTPDDAVLAALYWRPGLKWAVMRLERACDDLAKVMRRAC